MHSHKVIYLETSLVDKKGIFGLDAKVDGVTTSKELEALIVEQTQRGLRLVSITPLMGNSSNAAGTNISATVGMLVTFENL